MNLASASTAHEVSDYLWHCIRSTNAQILQFSPIKSLHGIIQNAVLNPVSIWKTWHTWSTGCKDRRVFLPLKYMFHCWDMRRQREQPTWNLKRSCTNSSGFSPCVTSTIFCYQSQTHTQTTFKEMMPSLGPKKCLQCAPQIIQETCKMNLFAKIKKTKNS